MNELAIIIVNYHSHQLVKACVDSLQACCADNYKVIVVDNSEPTEKSKLENELPDIAILPAGSNIGFAAACNVGINHAKDLNMDYYLLLNPDTRAEADFIKPMLNAMRLNPGLGMISPKILKDDKERGLWFAPGKINWWRGKIGHDNATISSDKGMITAEFLTGCVMLLRASAVAEVGLMEEKYFLYFEDTDYSLAFRNAGWDLAYLPESEILHAPSSTTGYLSELYLYYFARNQILFMKKWAKLYHLLVFQSISLLVMLPAAVAYFGVLKQDRKRMQAYINGCLDGFKGKTGKS